MVEKQELPFYSINQNMNDNLIKPSPSFKLEPPQVMRIFDLMPDFVYVLNLEKQSLQYTNERLYDVLGYTWDDVVKMNYTLGPVMVHEDLDSFGSGLANTFNNLLEDSTTEFNLNFRHKNGDIRELRNRGTVMTRHPDGRNQFIVVVAEDITESRIYEKLLAEKISLLQRQRDQMETAESIFNYGSWEYEASSDEIIYSEGLFKILGLLPEDYPNNKVGRFVYSNMIVPEQRRAISDLLENAVKNKETDFYSEHQIINAKGKLKHVALKAKCFYDDEKISRILGVIADRTEIEAYQIELERRLVALKKSNSELEQFAYVASHDLQEPLRKIISFGERLTNKHGDKLDEEGKFFVDRMTNSANRMQGMIQDLLTYSKVARQNQSFEPVSLKEIFKQVLCDLELKIQEKQATITYDTLPVINAQPLQMYQLFQNLLTNALKFTRPQSPVIISVRCELASPAEIKENPVLFPFINYYKIIVSDNGIGLEDEYVERIFALFQRLHGRSEYEGTGLGLAICRKIVEGHQGQIRATGTLGVGAEFTFYLPELQNIIN
jgi:PAS domain S-box-containing protein